MAILTCADCGADIPDERTILGYKVCLACSVNAGPIELVSHGDEDTGIVTLAVKVATESLVEVEPGRKIAPVLIRRRRDAFGRFSAGTPMSTGRTDPTRDPHPILDHWASRRDGTPIPGDAVSQSSTAGMLRARVIPKGLLPQNPWDRGPRDAGRRDFEAPTEARVLRDETLAERRAGR